MRSTPLKMGALWKSRFSRPCASPAPTVNNSGCDDFLNTAQGLQAVLAAEIIHAIAIHAKKSRRFRLRVARLVQRGLHPLSLERFDLFIQANSGGRQMKAILRIAVSGLHHIARHVLEPDGLLV